MNVAAYAKTLPVNNGIIPGRMVVMKKMTPATAPIAITSMGDVMAIKKDCLKYWKNFKSKCV